MKLDGSGQSVILDGQRTVQVLIVNSGVTFTLNALTIANSRLSGLRNAGTVSITNSTFDNNRDISGGGLFNAAGGTVSITNSTIVNNRPSGLLNATGSTMSIAQSIVANNAGADCILAPGTLTDQGYNLSSGTSCGFTGTGSLQSTDPKLDPKGLQDNGGPTQTVALEPDSQAVDHIAQSSCPPPFTDQRGVSRPQPQGGQCDIGAFEMTAADGIKVMIHVVDSFNLAEGLQTSLDAKLQDALTALGKGHTTAACGDLTDFIGQVNAQSGKMLTPSQASQLLAEAAHIRMMLGC